MIRFRLVAMAAIVALFVASCSSASDLSDAAEGVADTYLAPAYTDSGAWIAELGDLVLDLCEDPTGDAALRSAQDAWRSAESMWMQTSAGWFGPTTMDRADSDIGYQPTSGPGIEETLASDHVIDEHFVADSLPTTQKGLGALEYVLFVDIPLDERRCEFLAAVALNLAADSDALTDAWLVSWNGADAYVDQFRGVGAMALEPRASLGLMASGIIELTKKLTLSQIGKVLGVTSPTPDPDAYPEGEAQYGLHALRDQIEGLRVAYGSGPGSFSGAVASRDEAIDTTIVDALEDALAHADELLAETGGTSFAVAVATDPEAMHELYDALAVVRRTFETDVVSLLDLTLGFSDSDGDTG